MNTLDLASVNCNSLEHRRASYEKMATQNNFSMLNTLMYLDKMLKGHVSKSVLANKTLEPSLYTSVLIALYYVNFHVTITAHFYVATTHTRKFIVSKKV